MSCDSKGSGDNPVGCFRIIVGVVFFTILAIVVLSKLSG